MDRLPPILVLSACTAAQLGWLLAVYSLALSRFVGVSPSEFHNAIACVLRPWFLPASAGSTLAEAWLGPAIAPVLMAAASVGAWRSLSRFGGDDDQWKHTKKRLVERVARRGSRLVTVPAS